MFNLISSATLYEEVLAPILVLSKAKQFNLINPVSLAYLTNYNKALAINSE